MEKSAIRLSLILPFYGVERYIGRCLESIYQQDIPEEQYEVICINDCSPDNAEQIVLQYAQNHPNLKLIRHEHNKKLGAARNTGLKAARGNYVWFIDTDDYIQENCLKHILELCEQNDLEILHFDIQDNFGHVMRRLVPTDVVTGIEEELISKKQECIEITYPWNRIYKRDFLLSNGLWFNDLYGGDVIHTILAVNVCKRMKNVDEFFHFYRVDNLSSDTKSPGTAKKVYEMSYVLAQAIDEIIPQINPQWKSEIEECLPWRINTSLKGVLKLPIKEQRLLVGLLHQNTEMIPFIKRVGNIKARLILCYPLMMYITSILYKCLLPLKRIIRNTL